MKASEVILKLQGVSEGLTLDVIGVSLRNMQSLESKGLVNSMYGRWALTRKGKVLSRNLEWKQGK